MVKKHMEGGTLRIVMANEVKRVLHKNQDEPQKLVKTALELGVTPKTLRQWMGPVDKGGWDELQVKPGDGVEKLMKAVAGSRKKPTKKPAKKGKRTYAC